MDKKPIEVEQVELITIDYTTRINSLDEKFTDLISGLVELETDIAERINALKVKSEEII